MPENGDPTKWFMLGRHQGATYRDTDGNLHVYVKPAGAILPESPTDFRATGFGPAVRLLLQDVASVLAHVGPTTNPGTVSAHEFGHARYLMAIGRKGVLNQEDFFEAALELENLARRAHDRNAPIRRVH